MCVGVGVWKGCGGGVVVCGGVYCSDVHLDLSLEWVCLDCPYSTLQRRGDEV